MASIWRHPNSRYWTACYTTKEGKQVKRSTKHTKRKDAMAVALELERMELQARRGSISTLQIQKVFNELVEKTTGDTILTPSVEKYLGDWLADIKVKKSEATAERYGHTVDLFLKYLKDKAKLPMTAISSAHVEAFLTERLKEKVAPKTAIVDIKTLNVAFHRAERHAVILKNPVTAVELPKAVSSERDVFTPEQVKDLLDATKGQKDEWFTLILLGYFTGARLSDCATMKWNSVDFKEHVLSYTQKKTGKTIRVPLVDELYDHLHTVREFVDGDHICPDLTEKRSSGRRGLSEEFNRIVKRANINPQNVQGKGKHKFNRLTFHSLRHSFNSELANAGVHPEIRMRLTGHSSFDMNDRYTHQRLKPLEDAVSFLPSLNGQAEKKENGTAPGKDK